MAKQKQPQPKAKPQEPPLAPFRFVDLNKVVVPPPFAFGTADISKPVPDSHSLRLRVRLQAESPILIGDQQPGSADVTPYRLPSENGQGDWWIPGASLRGMLRSAAEIIGYGRLQQINNDLDLAQNSTISHDFNVRQVLDRDQAHRLTIDAAMQPDMVSALFGYVDETEEGSALKSRVAISGARIVAASVLVTNPIDATLGAPKPSFGPYYLQGSQKDWSSPEARLAGRKRYLPRTQETDSMDDALEAIRNRFKAQRDQLDEKSRNNPKTLSRLRCLTGQDDGAFDFEFELRLHNVSAIEAGLVLLALTFGGGEETDRHRHMLGRGKPYGLGQLRVADVTFLRNTCHAGGDGKSIEGYISTFKAYMLTHDADYEKALKSFLRTCKPSVGKHVAGTTYPWEIYLSLAGHGLLRKALRDQASPSKLLPP